MTIFGQVINLQRLQYLSKLTIKKYSKSFCQVDDTKNKFHLDELLISILVCPLSKSTLIFDEESSCLIGSKSGIYWTLENDRSVLDLRPHSGKILQKESSAEK